MAKQRRARPYLRDRAVDSGELAAVVLGRREQLGLRQEELAELAGCSTRFVHEVEHGKVSIQLDKLVALLGALGLHLELVPGTAGTVSAHARLQADLGLPGPATPP